MCTQLFRKTKPKNGHRHRKEQIDASSSTPCRNVGLWVAIVSNVGWLLILSYIVSMVHSEYAQLDRQQTKLSATLKTLPDEWHDKAHGLEVNQSTLFHKLFDLQQSLQNLTDDFLQLRAFVQQQQTQIGDSQRVGLLEKNLADFGAELKSFSTEMDSLKNHSTMFSDNLNKNSQAIEYFRGIIVARKLNETGTGGGIAVDVENEQKLENNRKQIVELQNLTQSILDRLNQVNATFSSYATGEQQKVDTLEESHTKKINELSDSVANITSQDVNLAMKNYQDQIKALGERLAGVEKGVQGLREAERGVEGLNAAMQRLQEKGAGDVPGDKKVDVTEEVPVKTGGKEGPPIM